MNQTQAPTSEITVGAISLPLTTWPFLFLLLNLFPSSSFYSFFLSSYFFCLSISPSLSSLPTNRGSRKLVIAVLGGTVGSYLFPTVSLIF